MFHTLNSEMRKYKSLIHSVFSSHLIPQKSDVSVQHIVKLWDSPYPTELRDLCKLICSRKLVVGGLSNPVHKRTDSSVFISHLPSKGYQFTTPCMVWTWEIFSDMIPHRCEEYNCTVSKKDKRLNPPATPYSYPSFTFLWVLTLLLPTTYFSVTFTFCYLPYFCDVS